MRISQPLHQLESRHGRGRHPLEPRRHHRGVFVLQSRLGSTGPCGRQQARVHLHGPRGPPHPFQIGDRGPHRSRPRSFTRRVNTLPHGGVRLSQPPERLHRRVAHAPERVLQRPQQQLQRSTSRHRGRCPDGGAPHPPHRLLPDGPVRVRQQLPSPQPCQRAHSGNTRPSATTRAVWCRMRSSLAQRTVENGVGTIQRSSQSLRSWRPSVFHISESRSQAKCSPRPRGYTVSHSSP